MKRLITNLRNIWYCDADASRATSTEILVQWKTQDPAKGYFPAHELLVKRDWAKKTRSNLRTSMAYAVYSTTLETCHSFFKR